MLDSPGEIPEISADPTVESEKPSRQCPAVRLDRLVLHPPSDDLERGKIYEKSILLMVQKSGSHQLRLGENIPLFISLLYIQKVVIAGFLNHQQYGFDRFHVFHRWFLLVGIFCWEKTAMKQIQKFKHPPGNDHKSHLGKKKIIFKSDGWDGIC